MRADPHFLDATANQTIRAESSRVKRAALVSSGVRGVRELRQTKELADGATRLPADAASASAPIGASRAQLVARERERLAAVRKPRKAADASMSIEQLQLEEDVLRRMHAPLNFLRNPRHHRSPLMSAADAPLKPPREPYEGMGFHVRPQTVLFTDYAIGGCYEIAIELHNVDRLSRRLRVLPPATPYFSISLVQYPGDDGFVAPGLHARVLVRFAPDSLGDYDDFILVQTETDAFGVPVRAARRPPALSLGEEIDIGWCFVGATRVVPVGGQNDGGGGRFAIVSQAEWREDDGIAERVAAEPECASGDLKLAPRLLDVPAGASFGLSITYAPTTVGQHVADLLLVCDNCHVRPLRIVGHACAVDVLLESIDGTAPPFFSPQSAVAFAETALGGSASKVVRYSNRTPLPIHFQWNLHPLAREALAPTRLTENTVLVWASEDCEPPMSHGDGEAGMPFAISPPHGALPAGGVAEFTISFAPRVGALHGAYAHFVISGVPDDALPSAERARRAESIADAEVGLQLEGRGTSLPLGVSPRALIVPAPVLVDVDHRFALVVRNPNDAPRLVSWRVSVCHDELAAAELDAAEGRAAQVGDDGASVSVEPARVLLAPGATATVEVVAHGHRSARCVRNIQCVPDYGEPSDVRLEMSFEGPRVRVLQPEVNFGLVALGDTPSADLRFENPTKAPLRWWIAVEPGGSHEHGAGDFTFSQPMGELAPGARARVRVTYKGHREQELQAALSIAVTRGSTTYVSARAQVVAYRISVDTPLVDMGVTHVRVPAETTVTLRNRTMLPTEWDLSGAQRMLRMAAALDFAPARGTLPPGGTQDVRVMLVSESTGELDEVVRCAVPQMARPLGIRLRSQVHGLVVSYSVEPATGEGTALGRELDRAVGDVHAPPAHASRPPPPLHFGRAVPCYEERHLLLVIRNHSSVPTRFKVRARDHPAMVEVAPQPAPPTEGMSTGALAAVLARGDTLRAGTTSRAGAPSRPQLGDAHEPLRRFQSNAGTRHVHERLHAERKRALFAPNDEVAFEVAPAEGVLPAWGRAALLITAHTQMWGVHEDYLLCEVEGLALVSLPLDVGVIGSPLTLDSNAPGFSLRSVPTELAFPARPVGDAPIPRRVRVRNDCAFGAAVEWALFEQPKEGRLVSAALAVDSDADGRVRLQIGPPRLTPFGSADGGGVPGGDGGATDGGADAPPLARTSRFSEFDEDEEERDADALARLAASGPPPFTIEPRAGDVPAFGHRDFVITYDPRTQGDVAARLVARCTRTDAAAVAKHAVHPPIALDVRGSARAPRVEFSERRKLRFQVSPLDDARTHASYRRELLIANREDASVSFTLRTAPPFQMIALRLSAGATTSRALAAQTGERADASPRCVLPPGETARVQILFTPTDATRDAPPGEVGSEATPRGSALDDDSDERRAADAVADADDGEGPREHRELHRRAHGAREHSARGRTRARALMCAHASPRAASARAVRSRASRAGGRCAFSSRAAHTSTLRSWASCTYPPSASARPASCARARARARQFAPPPPLALPSPHARWHARTSRARVPR